jgi:hypothetical protein
MAESTIHSERAKTTTNLEEQQTGPEVHQTPHMVIWTPTFILTFFGILVVILSVDAAMIPGWLSRDFRGEKLLIVHIGGIFLAFLALIAVGRSWWLRLGGLLGCLWTLFMSLSLIVSLRGIDPTSPVIIQLNAAMNTSLLATFICLSIDRAPMRRWDNWFFALALFISVVGTLLAFFLTPASTRSLLTLGNPIAATTQILSLLVWWLRPSCWQTHPGPTFLIGIYPFITLMLAIPNLATTEDNFYLLLVAHLSLFLGILRVIQAERMDWYHQSASDKPGKVGGPETPLQAG